MIRSTIFLIGCLCVLVAVRGGLAQERTAILRAVQQISTHPLDAIALSADGTVVVSGGRDNVVRVWDAASGQLRGELTGHSAWVTRVAISPDGRTIASGSQDSSVRLWDVSEMRLRTILQNHRGSVSGVAFSPDGRLLVTTGLDGVIWLGEASSGQMIMQLDNFSGAVWSAAFSPDSRRLASGSENGTIWIIGLYDNSVTRLDGHEGAVTGLEFNRTGTQLLSSSWDRTARLWDVSSSTPAQTQAMIILSGHDGPVTNAAFSESGYVTGALDGRLRVWDEDGQLLETLSGSATMIGGLVVSQNGRWLYSAGVDGYIESWFFNESAPVEVAVVPSATPAPSSNANSLSFLPVFTAQAPPTRILQATPAAVTERSAAVVHENSAAAVPAVSGGTILSMPTVNVFTSIKTFPLDGVSWAIDPWERLVGHLQGTAWFGGRGNIVLGGHSAYPNGRPGIFAGLYQLNIGDPIIITHEGNEQRFTVTQKFSVRFDDLSVATPNGENRLTLITCDLPSYNPDTQFYNERLVVVALPA
ncbi:MAG: sortase [Anaerolineae bacterium]|nr:sortase [Anaerolineae bacterium]